MFITLFLIFVKIFPSVSIYEVKETLLEPEPETPAGEPEWQPTH